MSPSNGETRRTVLEALRNRHSTARMKPEAPPRELVEQVIEAAGWAPNHYKTEPWRFTVLAGKAREQLGEVMARALRGRLEDEDSSEVEDSPEAQALLERERNKPLRAPIIVVVAAVAADIPKVVEVEEIAATAAAVQNMLLAAEAVGLGAMWRTGPAAYDETVKRFLDIPENGHLLGFVYLGYADPLPRPERERDALKHTTWRGSEGETA